MNRSTPGLPVHHQLLEFTAWQIEGEKVEAVTDFLFLGSKITVDGACSHVQLEDSCFLAEKL